MTGRRIVVGSIVAVAICLAALAVTVGCGRTVSVSAADVPRDHAAWRAAWDALLKATVDERGWIDFDAVEDRSDRLDRLVAAVGSLPDPEGRRERIAFHCNAYNVLAMKGVLVHDRLENLDGLLRRASFFKTTRYVVNGRRTNLQDYEDEVIRSLEEPRIHVAINCMSRSCPRLRREAYDPARIDAQLDAAMRDFVNDPRHVSSNGETVTLNPILDWFREDFPGRTDADLIAYLNRWRREALPSGADVRYRDYDWTIIDRSDR